MAHYIERLNGGITVGVSTVRKSGTVPEMFHVSPPSIVTIGEHFGEVKNLSVIPRAGFAEEISSSRNPVEAGAVATNCVGVPGGAAISPGHPGGR